MNGVKWVNSELEMPDGGAVTPLKAEGKRIFFLGKNLEYSVCGWCYVVKRLCPESVIWEL
jgi:hypothetical protein